MTRRDLIVTTDLVTLKLGLGVIFKVAVSLETVLDDGSELRLEEFLVVEVVDSEAGARGFAGVGWANTLLGGADSRTTELNFLEAVNDLVEVEDDLSTV